MTILRRIWNRWQSFGRLLGDVIARVVLTVFYFTIALPFGLGVHFLSDPLKLKPGEPRWEPRKTEQPTLDDAKRAF